MQTHPSQNAHEREVCLYEQSLPDNIVAETTVYENYEVFLDKTEYDEATGEISVYTVANAFTQQPSVDNNYTVDFNNPDASLQWYEVEESYIGTYTAEEFTPLFSYDFKAGDILKAEIDFVVLEVGDEYLELENDSKTATIKIDTDETIEIFSAIVDAENPVELEFTVIKETTLDGETDKTLQNPECGKNYWCKATVGEFVYISDTVVGHDIIQVEEKAPTCTEIGWDAYEYCTGCDYTTYVEKEALNHTFTKYEVTEAAKCGVEGKEVAYCDNGCGATDEKAIEALTHTDADGDYICDNGCGHEFQKPAPEEPTPDTPDEPEDETCADCGKVHTSFFSEIICFFAKIINFIKKLFA